MKNSKKVIVSLAATLILSTSVGHAQGVKYTIKTYFNNENIRYSVDYNNNLATDLYNRFGNIFRFKPVFNRDYKDIENNNEHNNNNKPDNNKKPNVPVKPTNPQPKPQEPKPEVPSKPIDTNNSIEQEVARLVNIERQKAGLAPLTLSGELSNVARIKSQDMADKNYFSHTSPTYGDPFAMMKKFGIKYGYAGENIAKGYNSAESVMNGWMNSSGHKVNILNPNFKTIGVGYVKANGTTYWTQMFTD